MVEDVKQNKASNELPYLDDLTGLYNRRYLEKVQKETDEFREKNIPFSVFIVDIGQLKKINETHGRTRADEVIKDFSQFLKAVLRATDKIIRYNNDKFICVMSNTEPDDVQQIYVRIINKCKQKKFGGLDIMINVGIASYPKDGEDFKELLRIADESLGKAKESN